jgi:hypothetical protein
VTKSDEPVAEDLNMSRNVSRAVAAALALALTAPVAGMAQVAAAPPQMAATSTGQAQLAQILAPVALYPDPVLTSILTASTYPLEVVAAARWVSDPANADLAGDQLLAALQEKDWDPSIKSLAPFPVILKMMSDQLDWTQQLGNAFLAQQAQVMDTVQMLRRQAQGTDHLASNSQQTVMNDGGAVGIEPTNPGQVAVPSYDPSVVYGAWPYPGAPPEDFAAAGYDPDAYDPAYADGWYFGSPVLVGGGIWFWGGFDWRGHQIEINRDRFGALSPFHPFAAGAVWQHDPAHRRGVAYRDSAVQNRFQAAGPFAGQRRLPTVFSGMSDEARREAPVANEAARTSDFGARPAQGAPVRTGGYRVPSGQARPAREAPAAARPRPAGAGASGSGGHGSSR